MLIIKINGRTVDIAKDQEISVNYKNFRFSDVIQDMFSTDIDFPRTRTNESAFDVYGLLDRGAIYTHKIQCSISFDGKPYDGYVQIMKITETKIVGTLFFSLFSYEFFDKSIHDFVEDVDIQQNVGGITLKPTIVDWSGDFSNLLQNTHLSFHPYYCGSFEQIRKRINYHPAMLVNTLLKHITAHSGVNFGGVNNDLYLLGSRKVVCPQNKIMNFVGYHKNNTGVFRLYGGQHITNDLQCETIVNGNGDNVDYWENIENSNNETITFNRDCMLSIDVWSAMRRNTSSGTIRIKLYSADGESSQNIYQSVVNPCSANPSAATHKIGQFTIDAKEGDWLKFEMSGNDATLAVHAEFFNYSITAEDYDTELMYSKFPFLFPVITSSAVGGKSFINTDINGSFCYFGLFANLNDYSVRELISSLCWYTRQRAVLTGNGIQFNQINNEKTINAHIKEIAPYSDEVGQLNVAKYNGEENPQGTIINNEFLEKEKVLHESIFAHIVNVHSRFYSNCAHVPQYNISTTDDETTVDFDDVDGLVLLRLVGTNNVYRFCAPIPLSLLGVENVDHVLQINGETFENIIDCDYINIDGRTYMLIDCDKNTTNGLTNFNALQVSKVYFPRVLQPQIFAVVTLISKDDVGDGKHFNLTFRLSTLNGKLKGYYENENGGPFYFTPMNDDGTFTMNNIPTGKTIGVYGYASYGTRHTPIPQNNILYVDV